MKIALDAGHGLKTAGKQTPDGIKEWELNDKVRDKVVDLLKGYNVQIICTDNDEGNVDEGLSTRRKMYVNQNVDAFVSIHHNAFNGIWNDATGVEVYTDKNPTSKDIQLANAIYKNLPNYTGLKGRGIKQANFTVINQNKVPAVLVEGGFMDSNNDYKVITSDQGQEAYARAVAEGLIEFLGLKEGQATVEVQPEPVKQEEKKKIGVDGKWGRETTERAQGVFGTPVDGIVSNQYLTYKAKNKGLLSSTFEWEEKPGKNGSALIKAIQRWIGEEDDGFIGPDTIRGMQRKLGTPVDGIVSEVSTMVKAFQTWLNQQ